MTGQGAGGGQAGVGMAVPPLRLGRTSVFYRKSNPPANKFVLPIGVRDVAILIQPRLVERSASHIAALDQSPPSRWTFLLTASPICPASMLSERMS